MNVDIIGPQGISIAIHSTQGGLEVALHYSNLLFTAMKIDINKPYNII